MGSALTWIATILEVAILLRGIQTRAFAAYPFFFSQLLCSFSLGLVCSWAYVKYYPSPMYARWYWPIQFVTMLGGSTISFEVFRPSLARSGRWLVHLLRLALIAAIGAFALLLMTSHSWRRTAVAIPLERNFRAFEALILILLVLATLGRHLPMERGLRGILLGYGLYVGVSVAFLATLVYYGRTRWAFTQALGYNTSLVIWLIALWRPGGSLVSRRTEAGARESQQTVRVHVAKVAQA